jgi:hypothetical protein
MSNDSTPPFLFQGHTEPACYRNPRVPSFRSNPLIEALPPLREREGVLKLYESEEPHWHYTFEDHLRLLWHRRRSIEPLSIHIDLARQFFSMLCNGEEHTWLRRVRDGEETHE